MKIRAITIGLQFPFYQPSGSKNLESVLDVQFQSFKELLDELKERFEKIGIEIQTTRVCTQPLYQKEGNPFLKESSNFNENLNNLRKGIELLISYCNKANIEYVACLTILADEFENYTLIEQKFLKNVPRILEDYENLFTSIQVASQKYGINLLSIKDCARIIKQISLNKPFNSHKFCVNVNVPEDTPFFPASYHLSDKPKFSIALEMADEVVSTIKQSHSLNDFQKNLKSKFEEIFKNISNICENCEKKFNIQFHGIDFSPAPFPEDLKSIGKVIEEMGIEYFGAQGTFFAVYMIMNIIKSLNIKKIGFSGFMQPILEDSILSKRLDEGKYTIDSLLLYSATCGTGLDCVPLQGDVSEREIFYILLDLASLGLSLEKPLTARLMVVPGKKENEKSDFESIYFCNSQMMKIKRLTKAPSNDLFENAEKIKFIRFL